MNDKKNAIAKIVTSTTTKTGDHRFLIEMIESEWNNVSSCLHNHNHND